VIVYSIQEAALVATIGSVTGLRFLCCGLAHGPWAMGREPAAQVASSSRWRRSVPRIVQGLFDWLPAAAHATVDDVMHMPRPGGLVACPWRPRRADCRLPPASPRPMVADLADEGSPAPLRTDADDADDDGEGML
jgi:hypothetical protein